MRFLSFRNSAISLVSLILIIFTFTSQLGKICAQSLGSGQSIDAAELAEHSGPVADSNQYLADTAKARSRQVEHRDYQGHSPINELRPGQSRLPENWDEIGEKQALPDKQSDAVFVADVTSSAAFLSTDRTGLFSSFEVKITQVLANHLGEAIQVGKPVDLERYGGRIRYPDGKIEEVNVEGRRYPKAGGTYIFFVEQTPKKTRWTSDNAEGLNIITAYKVLDGKVYALDRSVTPGALPYEKYDGMPEADFISAVKATIQQEAQKAAIGGTL